MHRVAENLWTLHYPLKVLGTNHGRTTTVIRLESGKLVLHSMGPFTEADVAAIREEGEPAWLVEAMLLHDTFAADGRRPFPTLPFLGPPGFSDVVKFPVGPLHPPPGEWRDEIVVIPLEGIPRLREHVVIHRPSRTLIVADLVFNFSAEEAGWDRFFHRHLAGIRRYPGTSRVFRLCVKDRATFQRSVRKVLDEDFDRIIPGHGEILETGGRGPLEQALKAARLM